MSPNPGTVYDRGPRPHATGTVSGSYYTVAAGDNLYRIGERFGLPWPDIAHANNLGPNPQIHPGDRLLIPGLNTALPPVYDHGPRPNAMGTVSGGYYCVAAGDTFYSIGLRFGLPHETIQRANNMGPNDTLVAGTWLLIPGLNQGPPPEVTPPPGRPFLGINSPTPGSVVYIRYPVTINGIATAMKSNRIIVRVKNSSGATYVQQETRYDASGQWHVAFSNGLPVPINTDGVIEAEAPDNNMSTTVNVHFR